MQALARGKYPHGQTWRQPTGAFRGGKITLQVIIGGLLLAETAQSGDSRFLILGKKVGIKSLLRIANLRQRRWRQRAVAAPLVRPRTPAAPHAVDGEKRF